MKKSMARIISVLLVALMAISMIPAVSAADDTATTTSSYLFDNSSDRTITVKNTNKDIDSDALEFVAYKVADITQIKDKEGVYRLEYTLTNAVDATKTSSLGAKSEAKDVHLVTGATGTKLDHTTGTNVFTLNAGKEVNALYLIKCVKVPTNVTFYNNILVQVPNMYDKNVNGWQYTVTVEPKAGANTAKIEKNIITANDNRVKTNIVEMDEVVPFEIIAPVSGSKDLPLVNFEIIDEMSSGFTYNNDMKIYGIKEGSDPVELKEDAFTIAAPTTDTEGCTVLNIKATDAFRASDLYDYTSIKITYSAQVNASAVLGSAGNANIVRLYKVVPGEDVPPEGEDKTDSYTYGIKVKKVDSETKEALKGAKFELVNKDDATKKYTLLTGDDGTASVKGLLPGKYVLTEIQAPENYQLLAEPIEIEVNNDTAKEDGFTVETVANTAFKTPATGGIGSTIFVVSGLAIIALGGALFFIASRKRESK